MDTCALNSGWHRAARRHDVRHLSRDGLRNLAFDLLAGGAISLPDHRLLSLDPVTYPQDWPGWSRFETPGDAGGQRDWIQEIETRLRKGYAEYAYVGYLRMLLGFLRRVEAAGREIAATQQNTAAMVTSRIPQPAST